MKVLDSAAPEPTPRPPVPLDREWSRDRELDMFSGVIFVWRYRYLIVSATLLAAALGVAATWSRPKEFTAIATVFVNIPRTQNPLAPDPLSVEALDRLANSELMQSQVSAELRRQNLIDDARRTFAFRTVLYKSAEPAKPYLPLLGLSVVASSPELARDAANVWATVMTVETRKLATATRASAVDFIVNEYPKASERLNEQERRLAAVKRQHGTALQAVKNAAAVSLKEEQLWSREQLVVQLEDQRNRLAVELKEVDATVRALEQELKELPALLTVSKAISDDALWDSAGKGKPGASLPDGRLQSQQPNPVHIELTRRLAEARVRRSELTARKPALDVQIEQVRREAMGIRTSLGASEVAIANLEREHEMEVAATEREVEGARANFRKLEAQIGDAQIVKADKESSLTLGSPAELPGGPSGPQIVRTIGLAGLVGLALGLFAAWVADRAAKRAAA